MSEPTAQEFRTAAAILSQDEWLEYYEGWVTGAYVALRKARADLAAAEARGRQRGHTEMIDALRAEARKRAGEVRLGGHAWCDAAADFLADFITKEGRNAAD